jgi:uncharacterized membrane protein
VKIVKIFFAILTAIWALALIPKLLYGISHIGAPFAFSYMMGSLFGMLLVSAISIALFRSAFTK